MGANQDNKRSWTILSYQLLANLLKEINNYKFIKIVLNGNYWVFYLGSKKLNQSVRCYFYGSHQDVVEPGLLVKCLAMIWPIIFFLNESYFLLLKRVILSNNESIIIIDNAALCLQYQSNI